MRRANLNDGGDLHPRAHSGLEATLHAFTRLSIGVVVLTLAARLFHGQFGVFEVMFLGCAVAVAASFGLTMGLMVGTIAFVVIYRPWPIDLSAASLRAQDVLFVLALGLTLTGVGLFTDLARRRPLAPDALEKRAPPMPRPPSAAARNLNLRTPLPRAALLSHLRRTLAAFVLSFASCAVAIAFHKGLGTAITLSVALAPALIAAAWTSGPLGLLIVGSAATVLAGLFPGAGIEDELSRGVGVIVASALGWRVGALGESARRDRDARKTVERAGERFSSCGDEAGIRSALVEGLLSLDPRASVEMCDEHGTLPTPAQSPARAVPSANPAPPEARTRRLLAGDRDFGEVRWRFSTIETTKTRSDNTATTLIDMGASAIARVRLSAERAEMENAMRAEQLRTILLDTVSHHFRSPLAGILGSVTGILNLPEPHEEGVDREFLLIIKEQANRLSRYVDNFLSLARLDAGAIEVNLSEVDLEELIYDVWDSFGASGGARRYLQVDLDADVVRSDTSLLTQIFGNVLENAIKYSPEQSIVAVSGARQLGGLLIEVSDQGRGVPEPALERMFGRFHRIQAGDTPGVGLGLYITRSLVEMLGGKVSARNRSDGQSGLVMSIVLPLTPCA